MAVFTAIGASIFGAGTFLAGLTAAGLQIAAGVAISLIGKAMQGEPQRAKFGVQGQIQGGDDVPRSINFGWDCTAGSKVYQNEWGTGGIYTTRVIAVGDYPVRELREVWVDGVKVTLADTSHATMGYPVTEYRRGGIDHLWIKFHDGTQTTADSLLTDSVASAERPYGEDRVGHGVPYVIATARAPEKTDDEKPLFQGFPQFKFALFGARWYDPTKDTTVGGDGPQRRDAPATWGGDGDFLPAVQLYNVLRGIRYAGQWLYGLQSVRPARVDNVTFIAAINKCRAAILGADGDEPTYRAGGEVQVGAQVSTTVEALLTACNGRLVEVGGTFKLYVGEPGSAVMSFDDGDIISTEEQTFSPFLSLADTVNGVSATYPNPVEGWNIKTAPVLLRPDLEPLAGNRRLLASVSLDMVPYGAQVQRLMKWSLGEALRARRHTLVLGPEYSVLEPGDVIAWTSARNGYVAKLFRVDGVVYKSNLDVIVDLTEVDPSDYDWNPETDYTPVADGPLVAAGPTPMPMQGWQVFPAEIKDDDGVGRRASIEVRFASGVADATDVRVQVRLKSDASVVFDGKVPYGDPWKVVLQGLFLGATQYEVRGRFVGPAVVEWSEWLTVTTPDIPDIDIPPIEVTMLGNELAAAHGWVTSTDAASLSSDLAALMQQGEEAALAYLDTLATQREKIDVLLVQKDAAVAGVIEAKTAVVSEAEARAQAIEEVIASLGEIIADGYAAIEAHVTPELSEATVTIGARATLDVTAQAALVVKASVDGLGGTIAQIGALGSFYIWPDINSDPLPVFSAEEDGVHVKALVFDETIRSSAKTGSTPRVIFDGPTGGLSLTSA